MAAASLLWLPVLLLTAACSGLASECEEMSPIVLGTHVDCVRARVCVRVCVWLHSSWDIGEPVGGKVVQGQPHSTLVLLQVL